MFPPVVSVVAAVSVVGTLSAETSGAVVSTGAARVKGARSRAPVTRRLKMDCRKRSRQLSVGERLCAAQNDM